MKHSAQPEKERPLSPARQAWLTHTETERITPELLDELRRIIPNNPEHLPLVIELMETIRRRHPSSPQVACFDTAFHRTMPRVATLLPIPRRQEKKDVQRYGFHGLSYAFLMEELAPQRPCSLEKATPP